MLLNMEGLIKIDDPLELVEWDFKKDYLIGFISPVVRLQQQHRPGQQHQ